MSTHKQHDKQHEPDAEYYEEIRRQTREQFDAQRRQEETRQKAWERLGLKPKSGGVR